MVDDWRTIAGKLISIFLDYYYCVCCKGFKETSRFCLSTIIEYNNV